MKFVYALALLIASVTVFGANAQRRGIENELEELELLITLDQSDYALDGLVSKIRDGFQKVVDRVKAKLADNKELLEQFRGKIEEVQQKIRDLVKQGGAKVQQVVQQIREKLQAIVKDLFAKLKQQPAFYDDEEQSLIQRIVQRLRNLLQNGIDRLKETLSSTYKDVLEQVKDKIAELQEKLKEVGKDFGIHALDKIHQLRESLVELLLDVKQKIADAVKGNQYSNYGVEELPALISTIKRYVLSDEGFLYFRDFARRVQSKNPIVNFVKIFINSQNDAYLRVVLEDLFKGAAFYDAAPPADVLSALKRTRDILNTPEGIKKIRTFAQGLKSEHQIVTQVVNLLRTVPDAELTRVITELFNGLIGDGFYYGNQYSYYGVEELPALISTIKKYVLSDEGFLYFRDFARRVQSKNPIVNFVKIFINSQNDAYLRVVLEDLFRDAAFYAGTPPADVLSALKRTRDILNTPEGIKEIRTFAQGLKSEHQIVTQVVNLLRTVPDAELTRVITELFNGLIGDNYQSLGDEDLADYYEGESLLQLIGQRLRDLAQKALNDLKVRVSRAKQISSDVIQALKEKIEVLQQQINNLSKEAGQKAIHIYQLIRQGILESLQRLSGRGLYQEAYFYESEETTTVKTSVLQNIINGIRNLAQRALNKIKERLAPHKEFFQQVKQKISELQQKIVELGKVTGAKAVEVIKSIRQRLRELVQQVKNDLAGSSSYAADDDDHIRELTEQLTTQITAQVLDIETKLRENPKHEHFRADLVKLMNEFVEISQEVGPKSLRELTYVHVELIQLQRKINKAISGY